MENIKRYAVLALVVFNIALAGAAFGAYQMHRYDNRQADKTAQAIRTALKVSLPQATSPKQ